MFTLNAQIPDVDLKLMGAHSSINPEYIETFGSGEYTAQVMGAGINLDVWLNRRVALGISYQRTVYGELMKYGYGRDENYYYSDYTTLSNANFLISGLHLKLATHPYRFVSFYASPSLFRLQYYYDRLNYGKSTMSIGGGLGCTLNISSHFRFNLFELHGIFPSESLIGNAKEGKYLFNATSGFILRINRRK